MWSPHYQVDVVSSLFCPETSAERAAKDAAGAGISNGEIPRQFFPYDTAAMVLPAFAGAFEDCMAKVRITVS
jgi:hypothetical protein